MMKGKIRSDASLLGPGVVRITVQYYQLQKRPIFLATKTHVFIYSESVRT